MQTYELRYPDTHSHDRVALRFEAEDVCGALLVLQKQESSRRAELWEDGEKLCELSRIEVAGEDIWIVGRELATQ